MSERPAIEDLLKAISSKNSDDGGSYHPENLSYQTDLSQDFVKALNDALIDLAGRIDAQQNQYNWLVTIVSTMAQNMLDDYERRLKRAKIAQYAWRLFMLSAAVAWAAYFFTEGVK